MNKHLQHIKNLLLILLLYGFNASAQTSSSFQHLSIENGLSANTVTCITQDAQGFIWIGTTEGLNKFNGYSSQIFRHDDLDSNSIPFYAITCSFKDKANRLWFGGNGVTVYDSKKERFNYFHHEKNNPQSLGNDDVSAITQDENGNIWIGTRGGLYLFDEAKKSFTPFLHDTTGDSKEDYYRNRVIEIAPDFHGNLWMTTIKGLYKFSLATHAFTGYLYEKGNPNSVSGNHISSLAFDKAGKLWLAVTDSGICVFDIQKNQFTKITVANSNGKLKTNTISKIRCDSKGKIWMATDYDGVQVFNPVTNEWTTYNHDSFDEQSLIDNKTKTLFEDASGMMWVGTVNHGVDRISSVPDKFISYKMEPGKPNSLCAEDISSVCETPQGNLWLGSDNGLMFFNRAENSFQCFTHDEHNSNSISDNHIHSLALDAKNNLWIATGRGLNCYSASTKKWNHFFHSSTDVNSIPDDIVFAVCVRSNGEVWAGTASGICRMKSNGDFENEYNNETIAAYKREYYTTVFEDSNHLMWLSTSRSGIFAVNDSFKIVYSRNSLSGLEARKANQFAMDNEGTLWIASTNGLFYFDYAAQKIHRVISDNKIVKDEIFSVVVIDSRHLWLTTPDGLTQVVLSNKKEITAVTTFNSSDGLQSQSFSIATAITLLNGELCLGGLKGFNLFVPENISYNNFIPPVQLTGFKIFDKDFSFANSKSATEIELNYNQNFFSFEMGAMSFDHPEKNQYAYQLEGFDDKMIYTGTRHFASYTNVPPGKYVLHIIASNNDGVWNKAGARITITIIPPFWKTNWFRIISILALLSLMSLIYFLRIRKIKLKAQEQTEINKKIAEARLTALRAQMNPHFIFNSLNSIQQFISASEKEEALKYLSRFSKLIRLVLQNADKNEIKLSDELNMLEFYLQLESLRYSNKFSFRFAIDKNVNADAIEIPTMLLQPYIENAVVHGLLNKESNGHLELTLNRNNNKLICTIEDNGIGREAAAIIKNKKFVRHESLGMKVTEERMQMLEQLIDKKAIITVHDLKDENGNATGTKVIIEIEIDD